MKRLLFVDDEPAVLAGYRRALHRMRREWSIRYATSGEAALTILRKTPVDIVVSDMRMPHMDGAELLAEVRKEFPDVIRIMLSGQLSEESTVRSLGPAHQFLSKPCPLDLLKQTIFRVEAVREQLADPELKRLVSQMNSLPSVPMVLQQVMLAIGDPNVSLAHIGKLIAQDVGMSAKVLQVVNTSFFGLGRQVNDVSQAVSLLGLVNLTNLVVSVGVFSNFKVKSSSQFSIERLNKHGMRTARFAKQITFSETQNMALANVACMAGMLHDMGELILASRIPHRYGLVREYTKENKMRLIDGERKLLGTTHAQVGAYLGVLWGLPHQVCEVVAYHEEPGLIDDTNGVIPLVAVHFADVVDEGLRQSKLTLPPETLNYLNAQGLMKRAEVWLAEIHRQKES